MRQRRLGTPAYFDRLVVLVMQLDLLGTFASPKYTLFEPIPPCFLALLLQRYCTDPCQTLRDVSRRFYSSLP